MKIRDFALPFAKFSVTLVLLFLALRKIDIKDLTSRLDYESIGWLALALLLTVFQIAVSALRWREVSTECGVPLTIAQVFRFNLIGSFFNQTLPSSIGGDAMRIWLVQRSGSNWRTATYSVFVDRAIGLIALAIIVVATLPWSYQLISDDHGRYALLFVDLAALAAGAGFLIFGRLPWPWLTKRWHSRHIFGCSNVANRLIFNAKSGPKIAGLSILVHVLTVTIAWCAARSIGAPVSFWQVFQLIPPVILITMIPVSIAGWGVREASMGLAFGYAGLMTSEGVNVSLLFGGVTFLIGALGGFAWVLSPEKSAQPSAADGAS